MKEARRAVLEARVQGLEASREAREAAASLRNSRRSDVSDVEAPLLPTSGAALPGSPQPRKHKEPSEVGTDGVSEGNAMTPRAPREPRALWRLVRKVVGESAAEGLGGWGAGWAGGWVQTGYTRWIVQAMPGV